MSALWCTILVGAAAAHLLDALLIYWIVPLFWLYPTFNLWAEVADHFCAEHDSRNHKGLFYRCFLKSHDLYHAVHHQYAYIPFYRLREARDYLVSQGAVFEEIAGFRSFLAVLYTGCFQTRSGTNTVIDVSKLTRRFGTNATLDSVSPSIPRGASREFQSIPENHRG